MWPLGLIGGALFGQEAARFRDLVAQYARSMACISCDARACRGR